MEKQEEISLKVNDGFQKTTLLSKLKLEIPK